LEWATKPLTDTLMQVWQKLYQAPGADSGATTWATQEQPKADEDWVVDAEVEEDGKDNNTRV
jgi:hypothetical protein